MNKTPITVALERQIPEYIRGEYEIFVNFIKAYYEFLDQTQQRNLEDIRSIENTLDEFVIRFKKELSFLFPTNTLENERFILQRIREFYKTRGSKESYQFLFKILFNKDSDIFYPSTQILRASDGKWVQEKSVFVKSESGNLFNLSGKIINIRTANKEIHVFCPRVVYYRDNIYEVFINRAYVQDISISDVVLSADGADYGSILPCPSKYTITSEGAGFEVGQLYYLKTESGDGSLIKITKIGTGGSVKKVQVISFGLDYKSTFYAKLSNKQAVALPYYHPVTSINGSTPPTPAYPDRTLGFIDYGYINTQDYFYFDESYQVRIDAPNIEKGVQYTITTQGTTNWTLLGAANNTVGTTFVADWNGLTHPAIGTTGIATAHYNVINRQSAFYADGTYVGEIVASFYTVDSIENSIDKDAAEIKIELGSVAIYPGYYSASDGFISDESYIQDGKYYQLFSYVIKVEQQIDSYLDIVKQLLHPAGLELYAEYTIKNDYLVSASPLLAFIRRQFLEQEYVTDDEATNSVYKNVVSDDSIAFAFHTFITDIKDVQLSIQKYRSNGTLAGETDERRWSTVDPSTFTFYDDDKVIPTNDSTYYTSDFRYNDVFQPKEDSVQQPLDGITNKDVTALKQDTQIADSESAIRYWDITSNVNGTFYQTTSAIHSSANDVKDVTTLKEDTNAQSDSFDRTVVYDRSIVPLVSLDPAQTADANYFSFSPTTKADTSSAVGGEWTWTGSAYSLVNQEVRIGIGYSRAPDLTLTGSVVSGSAILTLTGSSVTEGVSAGRILTKVSGTGAFGTGTIRAYSIDSSTSITLNTVSATSGTIVFTVQGETPDLAQFLSSPTDSFPDGSTQGLVKFAFSGGSYDKLVPTLDSFNRVVVYDRSIVPLATDIAPSIDLFPDGSTQGLVKFSFSSIPNGSWADTLNSPADSIPIRGWDKLHTEAINNNNTGTLYYNSYNQNDALDPTSSYSYEAEIYSVHDTRAIS